MALISFPDVLFYLTFLSFRPSLFLSNMTTTLLTLPYDIIANISQHLDLCSNTSLMDTCRHMRYMFLSSKYLWRRITFDLNHTTDLHRIYSSLRKLDDSNGLRQHVVEVTWLICTLLSKPPSMLTCQIGNHG